MVLQSAVGVLPLPVADGGTGAATLTGVLTGNGTSAVTANAVTQHGVLIAGASNAVSSLSVASTGQALMGSSGADPSFTSTPAFGGAISAAGNIVASASSAGATVSLQATNSNNANIASHAQVQIAVGGTSGGNPSLLWQVSGVAADDWAAGPDRANSYRWCLSDGDVVGTADRIRVDHTTGNLSVVTGDANVLAGGVSATKAVIGGNNSSSIANSDNTNGASNAILSASVGGASGGDPEAQFVIPSGATWSIGADNSASDAFVIAASAALGTSNAASWSTAGALTNAGALTVTAGNIQASNGNLVLNTAGNKIVSTSVGTTAAAGANSFGSVTLSGGTATVATTSVTASSLIHIWRQSIGATGAAALGHLSVGTIVAATSFVINAVQAADATALQASDVSVIGWMIVN